MPLATHLGHRHALRLASAILLAGLLGTGASPASAQAAPRRDEPASATPDAARKLLLGSVKSWGYQLKRIQVDEVAASPFDLVVIDYAPDRVAGYEDPFRPEQVAAMKVRPDGSRRLVLAYLSIGEAEWYRTYWKPEWQKPPGAPWLGPMNPKWYGNFLVRYWHPEWQAILFGSDQAYLDRIIAAGFDGVYLDRADTYEELEKSVPDAAARMASLVARLSAHARMKSPHFLVVMQNAEDLVARPGVLAAIDGLAKEDLYFGINHDEKANARDGIEWSLGFLRRVRRAGKTVLLVEYVSDPKKLAEVRRNAEGNGFLAYVAPRDLGRFALEQPGEPVAPAPAIPGGMAGPRSSSAGTGGGPAPARASAPLPAGRTPVQR